MIDVVDPVLPANTGRFLLDGGPDHAQCDRKQAPADLSASVADLAALYLGGVDATTLVRAGRITEITTGSARRADLFFGWRPAPWTITDW